ncbi:MAG: inverse autotransporter beta domain-containing protein [Alphaproteobacteria bacterium]
MGSVAYKMLRAGLVLAVSLAGLPSVAISQEAGKADWLARSSGEFQIDDNNDPRFSIETVQPIIQSEDQTYTLFWQGRAAFRDSEWTTNIGTGFRYLDPGKMWMLGVNGWYDRAYEEGHERWGVGAELFGPLLTGRSNYYDAFSGTKTISTTATTRVEERAVDGYDFELEAPVPYLPWARLGVTYYKWDTEFTDDIDGYALNLKMDVNDWARVEVGYRDDDADQIFSASLRIRFGVTGAVESTAAKNLVSDTAFVPRSVAEHTLDRVERHHGIVTERRTVSTTGATAGATIGGVTIGRGT